MWLGNDGVLHGVFDSQDFPTIIYTGKPIEMQPLSPKVFEILTLKEDWGKLKYYQ